MKRPLKYIFIVRLCLIFFLSSSTLTEVVFAFENTYNVGEIGSASSEGTNSCDEHHCPVVPNQPCQHCPVCCAVSHLFTNHLTAVIFHFNNSPQSYSIPEDVLYKELFAKTLFHPPQSIL
ncbi:MAG: hypothetical protein MRK02_10455 [Candidatus Scalindua sp.]|nr:hypothetical protein [Candidatus Scalindua sp.]